MVFSSYLFIFYFLPLVLAIYYLIGRAGNRPLNYSLILFGYIFYGWATDLPASTVSLIESTLAHAGLSAELRRDRENLAAILRRRRAQTVAKERLRCRIGGDDAPGRVEAKRENRPGEGRAGQGMIHASLPVAASVRPGGRLVKARDRRGTSAAQVEPASRSLGAGAGQGAPLTPASSCCLNAAVEAALGRTRWLKSCAPSTSVKPSRMICGKRTVAAAALKPGCTSACSTSWHRVAMPRQ